MTIDLQDALGALARSVQDDGTPERVTGQVRSMVTRIRRRRAVRQAATGAVSMGAAAAVAFGGIQLAGRDGRGVAGPVGPTGATAVSSDEALACGADAPDVTVPADGPAAGWRLDGEVQSEVVPGGTVQLDVRLADQDGGLVTWGQATPQTLTVAAVQDGRVVSSTLIGFADGTPGGSPTDYVIFSSDLAQATCDSPGGVLAPGEYSIIAAETLLAADDGSGAPVRVMGGPWPFTVVDTLAGTTTDDPTAEADADRELAVARAALEAHLASPSSDAAGKGQTPGPSA